MPSDSPHVPEQEISIKSRAHEVFDTADPELVHRATKPFPVYLRETPASPISSTVKAMLWFAAIIVALLFLAAVWKLTARHGPKRLAPVQRVDSRGGNLERDDRHRRRDRLLLARSRGVGAGGDPVEMHTEGRKGIVELTTANRYLPVFA
jgi:hypothetical protein